MVNNTMQKHSTNTQQSHIEQPSSAFHDEQTLDYTHAIYIIRGLSNRKLTYQTRNTRVVHKTIIQLSINKILN